MPFRCKLTLIGKLKSSSPDLGELPRVKETHPGSLTQSL
uniref:Uncharacterized protein n=1 Tax=Anguilla anguilla TaxID=7936 RepID=A0A0E9PLC7_ANGAN